MRRSKSEPGRAGSPAARVPGVLGLLLALAACGGNTDEPRTVMCGGEKRVMLDCSSEVSYQGTKTEGGASVLNLGSASVKHEENAIRRINEEVERYVAMQTRVCRDYNACVVDQETYRRDSAAVRDRITTLPGLVQAVEQAKGGAERQKALDALYQVAVPAEQRVEEFVFRMAMQAELPESVGGGRVLVRPGDKLPTNARVAFLVQASKDVHAYIFQKTPSGEVNVLFPDPRIGTENPLRAGAPVRIPSGGQTFRVNDKDIGEEKIYVVASRQPVARLGEVLAKVSAGDVKTVRDDPALGAFAAIPADPGESTCKTRALELDSSTPCVTTRALELDEPAPAAASATAEPSFSVKTQPGDDKVVYVFPFKHVAESDYRR